MSKRKVKKIVKKGARKAKVKSKVTAKKNKVFVLAPNFKFELPYAVVQATTKIKRILSQPIHLNKLF